MGYNEDLQGNNAELQAILEVVEALPDAADYVIGPETGTVGQALVVKELDENGRPAKWETVDFPEGGGGDGIPVPETAAVGQTVVVKTVDENGKPTEWEAVTPAGKAAPLEWREDEFGNAYQVGKGAEIFNDYNGDPLFGEYGGNVAEGEYSHVEGVGTVATYGAVAQHVQGRFNVPDTEQIYLHIVGNGWGVDDRSNAHTLDEYGTAWFAKEIKVGGTGQNDEAAKLVFTGAPEAGEVGQILMVAETEPQDDGTIRPSKFKTSYPVGENLMGQTVEYYYTGETYECGDFAEAFNGGYQFNDNVAAGAYSHAEGSAALAAGYASHAEGSGCRAMGDAAHAEGAYTIAGENQHAQGRYNIEDTEGKYAHIVGNGFTDTNRSNAHTLDWSGLGWFAGGLKVGGTGQDDENAVAVLTTADMGTITQAVIAALPVYNGEVEDV